MRSAELMQICRRMVNPRTGIIRRIADVPLQPGEPEVFILAAHCTRPKYFLRNDTYPLAEADYAVPANGVAFDRDEALWRVIGEACERYAAGLYDEAAFTTASRNALGAEALPVERLIAFSDAQYARVGFPFVRFDPDAPLRWVRGTNLATGRTALIPAALVFLGYEARLAGEAFYPTTSTGMAAGRTLEQALFNAVCEVVERDAFMCTWLLRRPPAHLDPCQLRASLRPRELKLLTSPSARTALLLVRTDVALPTVLTVVRPGDRRKIVVGAATRVSLHDAVIRSALEAFHTLNWSIFLEQTPRTLRREDVRDLEDHVRYYLDERNFPKIAWLLDGSARPASASPERRDEPRGSPADDLARALARLSDAGLEAYAAETTTRDVKALGLRTVRVIVPGLQPLNVGHGTVHEDSRRLDHIARQWSLSAPYELNPEPHPFP